MNYVSDLGRLVESVRPLREGVDRGEDDSAFLGNSYLT